MSIDQVSSPSLQTSPLYSAAKTDAGAGAGAVTDLVVQSYKVEANKVAIRDAGALFEAYTGKLKAAEIRLETYANQKNPTEEGLKKIKADIVDITALVETVKKGIGAAMDDMEAAAKAAGFNVASYDVSWSDGHKDRFIGRSGETWQFKGFYADFNAASQLPVKANTESIQLHTALIDQYKEEMSGAKKLQNEILEGRLPSSGSKTVKGGDVGQFIGWLEAEINKTHTSLRQAEQTLQPWSDLGLTAQPESKLPVQPNVDSLRSHKELMARYEQELSAADKALGDLDSGLVTTVTRKELQAHKSWLQGELAQTQASLRKAEDVVRKDNVQKRDQYTEQYDQMKGRYDKLCLELSTIKDNGAARQPARAAELDKQITQLEVSMKDAKASIELADSVISATYTPAR